MSKQSEETKMQEAWVEPAVWTPRMLMALEQGVKGGIWFSLIDKVYSKKNLEAALSKVSKNAGAAGADGITVENYESHKDQNLAKLSEELKQETYKPQSIRRQYINKLGSKELRPLGIPTVRDRVVQTALRQVIEPIFEKQFAANSYGFRPRRSCKDALRRVDNLLAEENYYIVDADIKGYFEAIDHARLMELVKSKIADSRMIRLIESFLTQKIMEELKEWEPESGVPQGAVISPLLSNLYLDELDHKMASLGYAMTRYADDLVIMCKTESQAQQALETLKSWMESAKLTLHPDKTRVVDMKQLGASFEFLGYRFENFKNKITRWPRKKSLHRMKDKVRQLTKRNNGNSLREIINKLNPSTKGWMNYFKHSHKWTFPELDAWIRMRLRSILRKRLGLKGCGRGADHQRWNNNFFEEQGLFFLTKAHATLRQSALR